MEQFLQRNVPLRKQVEANRVVKGRGDSIPAIRASLIDLDDYYNSEDGKHYIHIIRTASHITRGLLAKAYEAPCIILSNMRCCSDDVSIISLMQTLFKTRVCVFNF